MLYLRSIVIQILFYLYILIVGILSLPAVLIRPAGPMWVTWAAGKFMFWLLRTVGRIRFEIRGQENIPEGACLVISKHQSLLETMLLSAVFPRKAFVFKQEIFWFPFFGLYVWGCKMIAIRRGDGAKAMRQLITDAEEAINDDRQLIIFPEGNRKLPGAPNDYKPGAYFLYKNLDVPVLPLALNTGFFWPKGARVHRPGTLVLEILPAVASKLDKKSYQAQVVEAIERACNDLNQETLAENPNLSANLYKAPTNPGEGS